MRNLAFLVELVLLINTFVVVISAVGVPTSPGNLMRLPPTVNRVRRGSAFCGRQFTQILPYVTSFLRSEGTWLWGIKNIVSVPFSRPPTP